MVFPEGKAGNIVRGAFGTIFRQLACVPECRDARACELAASCPYAKVFEPRQQWTEAAGPSGLADWPRSFVFRAMHLDGRRLQAGEPFHFDLVLFETPNAVLPYFVLAFRQLAEAGLGPGRGRAALTRVEDLAAGGGEPVFDGSRLVNRELAGIRFDLSGTNGGGERPGKLADQWELLNRVAFERARTKGGRASVSALLVDMIERHRKELEKELASASR